MLALADYRVLFSVSLQQLKALVDRKTGKRVAQRPRFVKQDQIVIACLQTSGVICLETFKEFPQMARFTLRDEGMVICDLHFCACMVTLLHLF